MAINQHLFLLTPVGITPVLDNGGWHYGENFVFPIHCPDIEKTFHKYLERNESWSPEVLYYKKDGIVAEIFIKDGQDNRVESINLRISLSKLNDSINVSPLPHSLDDIMKIANMLVSISQELGLKLFDPYKKKIVETKMDIINSICTSRPGKLYGYGKYKEILKNNEWQVPVND